MPRVRRSTESSWSRTGPRARGLVPLRDADAGSGRPAPEGRGPGRRATVRRHPGGDLAADAVGGVEPAVRHPGSVTAGTGQDRARRGRRPDRASRPAPGARGRRGQRREQRERAGDRADEDSGSGAHRPHGRRPGPLMCTLRRRRVSRRARRRAGREPGQVAGTERRPADVLRVHQLTRVVDVVEADQVPQLVQHDGLLLPGAVGLGGEAVEGVLVEHDHPADVAAHAPVGPGHRAAQPGDLVGEVGHLVGLGPADQHRLRPAEADPVGEVTVVGGADVLELQPGGLADGADADVHEPLPAGRCAGRVDDVPDRRAGVPGDRPLAARLGGEERVAALAGRAHRAHEPVLEAEQPAEAGAVVAGVEGEARRPRPPAPAGRRCRRASGRRDRPATSWLLPGIHLTIMAVGASASGASRVL